MACYIYKHIESADLQKETAEMEQYAKAHKLSPTKAITDSLPSKTHWSQRPIGELINQGLKAGDTIIVYDPGYLACSTSQILEILSVIAQKQVHVHFVKYGLVLENNNAKVDTCHLLKVIARVESDFVSKRTTFALAKRRAAGLPLGRPKGRGNKSLKLDKHKEEIDKYLKLGISKASIAKLVGCHAQTLYDWLERHQRRQEAKLHEAKIAKVAARVSK